MTEAERSEAINLVSSAATILQDPKVEALLREYQVYSDRYKTELSAVEECRVIFRLSAAATEFATAHRAAVECAETSDPWPLLPPGLA